MKEGGVRILDVEIGFCVSSSRVSWEKNYKSVKMWERLVCSWGK